MIRSNATNLKQKEGGRVVKQGDSASLFAYELLDEKWRPVPEIDGQQAKVDLIGADGKAVFESTVSQSKVSFKISKPLPVGSYLVEVHCAGYVFPSDQSVRIDVIQSADQYTTEDVLSLVKNDVKEEIGKFIREHQESGITEEFPDLTTLYNLAKI